MNILQKMIYNLGDENAQQIKARKLLEKIDSGNGTRFKDLGYYYKIVKLDKHFWYKLNDWVKLINKDTVSYTASKLSRCTEVHGVIVGFKPNNKAKILFKKKVSKEVEKLYKEVDKLKKERKKSK